MLPREDPWAALRPWRSHPTAHLEAEYKPWLVSNTLVWESIRSREHRRAAVKTDIWLGTDGIFTRSPGELRDLSEGGAFVQTSQRFTIGSLLNLGFHLPGTQSFIRGSVAVRHQVESEGIGVEFIDLSIDDRIRVREYVASLPG